jgi:hypothetical protein
MPEIMERASRIFVLPDPLSPIMKFIPGLKSILADSYYERSSVEAVIYTWKKFRPLFLSVSSA